MAFLAFLVPVLESIGMTLALDLISAAFGGQVTKGQKLSDKSISSSAYGLDWKRCRGSNRLPANVIYATKLHETTHKTVGGGIFGLGQSSMYYYSYSVSFAAGFGKKLGGGSAQAIKRMWADGKLLYSAAVTDAALVGSVTLVGPVSTGAEVVTIQTGAASSVKLSAGDFIAFDAQPNITYEVQEPLILGANAQGQLSIFPGVDMNLPGGGQIHIPGLNAPHYGPYFDPDPHDGSHYNSTPDPPGGINFHLGDDLQAADPIMLLKLGAGNTPAYRGLCYAMVYYLQLVSFGNHIPSVSGEIQWDEPPAPGTIEVPGTTGPWNVDVAGGVNAAYDYDSHDWTAPVIFPRTFSPGDQITLSIQNNRVSIIVGPIVIVTGTRYPMAYVPGFGDGSTYAGQSMGAWCDGAGNVIQPVFIGNLGATLTCPAGASVLQLGVDDKQYNDNGGSYFVVASQQNTAALTVGTIIAALEKEAGHDASQYDVSLCTQPIAGVEFPQEPFKNSIQTMMELYLIDSCESDGKTKYVPRGGNPIFTIPEDDLGASDGSGQPAPRLTETITRENDVPQSVWIKYYDRLKQYQQATQYQKRISQPYASDLLDKQPVTHSRTQLILNEPVSDVGTPMKQQAEMILYDKWTSRSKYQFKTPIKWIRLDPTDPGVINYKGNVLNARVMEADRGAGLALQFQAEGYDRNVYSSVALSDGGLGSGTEPGGPPTPPPTPPDPVITLLLGSASDLTVDITAPSGAEDGFTIAHSLGQTPAFAIISGHSGGNVWFDGARYDGTLLHLKGSAAGIIAKAYLFETAPAAEISLAPTADGDFAVAHSLAAVPGLVLPQMTSGGNIWSQPKVADSALAYFTASDAGVTAKAGLWLALIGNASPSVNKLQLPLSADADGNFQVPHGLGIVPKNVFLHMKSPGFPAFWFQDGVSGAPDGYDDVNIYLVSPGAGVSGFAEVLY